MLLWGLSAGVVEAHAGRLGVRGSRGRRRAGGRQVVGILVRLEQHERTACSFGRWCVLPLFLSSGQALEIGSRNDEPVIHSAEVAVEIDLDNY
jgi:hypothetical protein